MNIAPFFQPNGELLILKPHYGNQWEVGVKTEIFNSGLTGFVSFYNVDVKTSTRTEQKTGDMYVPGWNSVQQRGGF